MVSKQYILGGALVSVPFIALLVLAYYTGTLKVALAAYAMIASFVCLIIGVNMILDQLDRSK